MKKISGKDVEFTTTRAVIVTEFGELSKEEVEVWGNKLPKTVTFAIWQQEITKEQKKHIQAYLEFDSPKSFTTVKNMLADGAHVETRKGTAKSCIEYCTKLESRVVGYWKRGVPKSERAKLTEDEAIDSIKIRIKEGADIYKIYDAHSKFSNKFARLIDVLMAGNVKHKVIENFVPKPWQKKVIDLINGPFNDRKIFWVVDETGGAGKTYLASWLIQDKNAYYIRGGKELDIAHRYNNQDLVIFDFTRGREKKFPYSLIEKFKDGKVPSGKYHGVFKGSPSCNVLVFSNELPKTSALSVDRWHLMVINPPYEVRESTVGANFELTKTFEKIH